MYLGNYDYKKWGPVEYAKEGDACFDLRSCISGLISKDRIVQIPLGIKVAVPPPFVMKLYIRSGQAKNNEIMLANGTGIIDQGYRGEVCALIKNINEHDVYISAGERIVQASLELSPQAIFEECKELPESSRGEGGFGHTGIA
jgi:dUTP pyrophosphatase